MRLCLVLLGLTAIAIGACTTSQTIATTATDQPGAMPKSTHQSTGHRVFDMPYLLRDLDNGLKVMVVRTDYPDIVNLQIPVQTGSRNEVEEGKSGFAHFFEHMMFRGTDQYSAEEYGRILKNAGADQNAYTTDDYTNYHITFTKADLPRILELEADRFMHLNYTEEQFRTEALAVKGEYLKNFSNPVQKLFEVARDRSYKTHTYKHTTMGFLRDIEDMPDQIDYSREFFDRWYRPEKAAVIVVGDVDPEATFALVKKYFGGWERGSFESQIPAEPAASGPIYEHIAWEAPTQPWLIMAFRGPNFDPTRKDMPTMDVLSSIYFSQSSDVYQKVVNQERLADQFFPYFPDRKDPGLLYIGARLTDAANATAVQEAVYDTLARARTEPVDEKTLNKTKSRLRYQFVGRMDNSEAIGGLLASFIHFERDPEIVNRVYEQYAAITSADLTRLANVYFVDRGRTIVTLSNEPELANFDPNVSIDRATAMLANKAPTSIEVVALQSASSPLVDFGFLFHAGSADDPAGKEGLASLTAAMLTQGGSKSHSIQDIDQAMYPMAASFDAQVDKEMIRLSGTVHKDNLEDWYALVREQTIEPGWREDDFERLKQRLINAVRTDLVGNNDEELGKEVLYQSVYGDEHPYGSLNGGHTTALEALTLADVKAFYAEHLTAENLTLALAGGYSDEFASRVVADAGRLPHGRRSTDVVPPAPMFSGHRAIIVEKETPAVAVSFGFPIDVRRGDDDWVALWLARSWLGEHRSTNSHLYDRIREARGMNYGDYAYIEYFPHGMFQFHPDANLGRQQQIFQVWIRPLRNNNDAHFATRVAMFELQKLIDEGLRQDEFEATRNYLDKFASLLVKTQSRQIGYSLDSRYYDTDAFTDYVREGLAKLTLGDVNRAIRKHLQTKDVKFVFITKDAQDLKARLASDTPSPIEYNSPKPDLADEDISIARLPLALDVGSIEVVAAEQVFN